MYCIYHLPASISNPYRDLVPLLPAFIPRPHPLFSHPKTAPGGCNSRTISSLTEIEFYDKNQTIPWDVSKRTVSYLTSRSDIDSSRSGQTRKESVFGRERSSRITLELRIQFSAPSCSSPQHALELFKQKFSANFFFWMGGFPKPEHALSIACCVGHDLYRPIAQFLASDRKYIEAEALRALTTGWARSALPCAQCATCAF